MAKKVSRPTHKPPTRAPEQKTGRGSKPKEFDNTNRGVLFENDKEGNEARPDFTGNIFVEIPESASPGDLVKFRLAGWKKESKSGSDFLSLSISLPKEKQ